MSVKDLFKKFSEPEDIDDRDDLYDSYEEDDRAEDDGYRDSRDRRSGRGDAYREERRPDGARARRAEEDGYRDERRRPAERPRYSSDDEGYGYEDDSRRQPRYSSDEESGDGYYAGSGSRSTGRRARPADGYDRQDSVPDGADGYEGAPYYEGNRVGSRTVRGAVAAPVAEPEPVSAEPACFLPESYREKREEIAACLRDGQTVLIDVSRMEKDDIAHMIDFLVGVSLALRAELFRLADYNVIALTPEGTEADTAALLDALKEYEDSLPQEDEAADADDAPADSAEV